MPDVQWQISAQENVSSAVQRIGQALVGLESTSSRAAGALVQAFGQAQTAATATAGAVQRIGAQPLRLTDQATPALTHLVAALRELVATRVQIPVSVQDTATPALTRIRAELASLSAPGALTLTLRDDATPLLTHLRTALGTLAAPAPIPLTVQDQATPVVQRLLADLQRLASTPIRIPVTTTGPPATSSPAAQGAAAADPAGTQRLAQQAAAAQGAVQSLGTRLDTLQRQLAGIGQTRPTITLTSNYQALQAEIATLQSRLTALSKQPYSVQVKTETAQVRADLAGLQRQFAGFKAELPPLAPKVDSGPVESALRRMQQGFTETGRAAQQHSGAVSSFFSNALSAATGFLAANVFSKIAGGFAQLGQDTIQQAGTVEQLQVGYTQLLGSASAATEELTKIRQLANVTPFEFKNLAANEQQLLAVGESVGQARQQLVDAGNAVAAFGRSADTVDRLALAFEQVHARGKLMGDDARQFEAAGIPIWNLLGDALHVSAARAQELSQAGKITADTFEQAFHVYSVEHWGDAMRKQSGTILGLESTASDLGHTLEATFGAGVIQAVEPVLQRILTDLSDPSVQTTLTQWGAAAGQFAVGLIQAGQTAFTVAQQIIQALQPVTDFIGGLLGISGPAAPTITPPDFSSAAAGANQFGANIKAGADNTKSAKDQVAELERQTRDLSRATAEANVGYDHRKQSLQDQLTLLDRQYQAENKAADVQSLQEKIAKDRVLAVNQYSSQGQAAASRLVDEEARLKQLQREQGHDAAKAAIDDRIKSIDREKQATDEASAARTRALQEQMDALRANAAATTALTNAIKPPAAPEGPNKRAQHNAGEDLLFSPETTTRAQTTIGLLQQLQDALKGLSGAPKAAVDALKQSWDLLAGGFAATPAKLTSMGHGFDDLIDTLGGKGGLQGVAISVRYEFERLFESLAAAAPTVIGAVGRTFTNLGDSINVATTSASELIALFKLQTGAGTQAQFDQAHTAAAAAQETYRKDQIKAMVDSALQGGTYSDRIKAINADLNARETRDLNAAAARTQASRDARLGGVTQASTEYASTYGPQVTTTTARTPTVAPVQHNIRMEFDARGFKRFIDTNTGQVLGDALR